eukprot:10095530-Lingulodinium_polyedra.AAC.1
MPFNFQCLIVQATASRYAANVKGLTMRSRKRPHTRLRSTNELWAISELLNERVVGNFETACLFRPIATYSGNRQGCRRCQ